MTSEERQRYCVKTTDVTNKSEPVVSPPPAAPSPAPSSLARRVRSSSNQVKARREKVAKLTAAGKTALEIAKELNCSIGVVFTDRNANRQEAPKNGIVEAKVPAKKPRDADGENRIIGNLKEFAALVDAIDDDDLDELIKTLARARNLIDVPVPAIDKIVFAARVVSLCKWMAAT
jgi:DNA-binding CsgD family transcriptional regulator